MKLAIDFPTNSNVMVLKSVSICRRLGMPRPAFIFIYISFFSLGFGFAVYLILAFWLRLKDLIYTKRTSVFDL